jgi:hypothetical protein
MVSSPNAHDQRPKVTHLAPGGTVRVRRNRSRSAGQNLPLGSLTQRGHRPDVRCGGCGSTHITRLDLCLTDGTPVNFTSCHRCDHRSWEHQGRKLETAVVLERSRKVRSGVE